MRVDWNRKYTTVAVYAFLVVASSLVFFVLLTGAQRVSNAISGYLSIFYPFITGFAIAYLLNFPLKFFKRHLSRLKWLQGASELKLHVLGMVAAYVAAVLALGLFGAFIMPQLVHSIAGLLQSIPDYIRNTNAFVRGLPERYNLGKETEIFIRDRWAELSALINNATSELLSTVLIFVRSIAEGLMNFILGLIISVYLLAEKNRFITITKKVVYSLFSLSIAKKLVNISRRSHRIFGNFLVGKALDSLIIGILTFVILFVVRMPYALLVAFIVGVTNIVPFFGPFIGAIPSFVIIFFESPSKALWFLVIILIIQQLDGNVIGPRILGDSLGISSFWVLFAILVSGKIFGFIGMVIGVPLFVLIYSLIKEALESRLEKKGLPTATAEYKDK